MNRRGLLVGAFMGFMAKMAGGQPQSEITEYGGLSCALGPHSCGTIKRSLPRKRDDAQYAICRQRGHVAQNPEVWEGGTYTGTIDSMVHSAHKVSDASPVSRYEERVESPWQTCFYCKRDFRTVTTLEER